MLSAAASAGLRDAEVAEDADGRERSQRHPM